MPKAKPPIPPQAPAPISAAEETYILDTVRRFYGPSATVRNWGPDPRHLCLHVEAEVDIGMQHHECVGLLMCEIGRDQISVARTIRGQRPYADEKLAYRQGVVLGSM